MEFNLEQLKSITILYVEDEAELRKSTELIFNKLFKKIYVASDGQMGIDIFNSHKDEIDIVITDINMPNKNGFEMLREILEITHVPIIVTTAHTDEKYLTQALDLKIDKYIKKPIKIKNLTSAIAEFVLTNRKTKHLKQATATLLTKSKELNNEKKDLLSKTDMIEKELKLLRHLTDNYICSIKTDKKGIIEDVSIKFCNLYEYTKDEIIGQSIMTIQDEQSTTSEMQKYMLEALHTRQAISTIHNFVTKNGKSLECDMIMTPIFSEDGYVNGYTFYQDLIHI